VLFKTLNRTRGKALGLRVRVAKTLWRRAVGLLNTPSLPAGEGLWITPCKSIHTFFMRYPIDVVFLNGQNMVIYAKTLPPWRASAWCPKALGVLELPAGMIAETGTKVGDQIEFQE
jgi:uncharacterized membrane protein (UPF0127 family)